MKGIKLTQEIKDEFDKRIEFLEKRIEELHQEFPDVKKSQINGPERLFDWKTAMLCHRNELGFRQRILEDAEIID